MLLLGLHRNGAVDGFVYHAILPRATFLISTQLRKNALARLFFDGIAVARTKDEGDRSQNAAALRECLDLLRGGGQLFVFPEGTSSLGPRHLPFKSGAAQILFDYLATGGPIQVVPLGIHYECPWAFRSKVEVVVGEPIDTRLASFLSPLGKLKELKKGMQSALEEVGVNVASDEYQEQIQRIAYVSTLATARSYFKTLKALEKETPERILNAWRELAPKLEGRRLLYHQGVPLFPMGSVWLYGLALLVIGPPVLAAIACNLPPFLAGGWAGKKFPDARNVIALWRILAGVPVFILWTAGLIAAAAAAGQWLWLTAYLLLTGFGLVFYYRAKKLAVAVHNGARHPELKNLMLAFRETVLQSLPGETD